MSDAFLKLEYDDAIVSQVRHADAVLSKFGYNYLNAAKSSLARTKQAAKTEAGRRSAEKYQIKKSTFMGNTRFDFKNPTVHGDGLDMSLGYRGFRLAAMDTYPARHISGGIGVKVRRDKPLNKVVKPGAFVATMKTGKTGVFRRKTRSRFPIKRVFGLATSSMLENEAVMDPLQDKIMETFVNRMDHEVYRIMSGFGG